MEYREEEYLQLSGIQHFVFCRRQWALAYLEQQWVENERTADGRIMHRNVHDSSFREKRGDLLIVRGMKVSSARLGLSGECDAVEFRRSPKGVPIFFLLQSVLSSVLPLVLRLPSAIFKGADRVNSF